MARAVQDTWAYAVRDALWYHYDDFEDRTSLPPEDAWDFSIAGHFSLHQTAGRALGQALRRVFEGIFPICEILAVVRSL